MPKVVQYKSFCVKPNVFEATLRDYERISLIIHASADQIDERMRLQLDNWEGPVSLSVVLNEPEDEACAVAFVGSHSSSVGPFELNNIVSVREADTGRCAHPRAS